MNFTLRLMHDHRTDAGQEMYHYCRAFATQAEVAERVLNGKRHLKHGWPKVLVASSP